ncbi:MAG: ABC transporter permease subunit [Candidatus Methanoplasma sp.]|nr:ABC transporter permease subunit [Candidatus Methanoplasma sp.]
MALVTAFPLGLLLGFVRFFRDLASPAIEVLRPIAPVAWAPVLVILYGSVLGSMLVVFVGAFFPILTNVIFGVRKIDPNWVDATKVLGASKLQTFVKVVIPSSIPYLMNGVKISMGIGWMCIVSAELYSSAVGGLGSFITSHASVGNWPNVYAGIVLVGILGIITVGVAGYLHKIISKKMGMDA